MDNNIEWIIPNFTKYFLNEKTTQLRLLTPEEVKKEDQQCSKTGLNFKIQFSGYIIHAFRDTNGTITTLYECKKCSFLLGDGSLQLRFEYKIETMSYDNSHFLDGYKHQCNEFKLLLSDNDFSDIVTVKSVEGNEYKVHKSVLNKISKVMKAHFEHDTTESQTNIVESPLEDEVLKDTLTYVYYKMAASLKDMPEKLLAAADYYQLSQLKGMCEEALCAKLCVENAIDTLLLADLYSASILKQYTLEFMKDEATLIIGTKGWAKLNSTDVLKEFCHNILYSNVEFIKPSLLHI